MTKHFIDLSTLEAHVREIVADNGSRRERLRALAADIHAAGNYRWVGIYEVTPAQVRMLVFSGPHPPAHPVFSRDRGLTGEALRQEKTVVAGDVKNDPNYLTAFGDTRSEMIVLAHSGGQVVGTIDAESDRLNAFGDRDRNVLERVAELIAPLLAQSEKS